MATVAGDQGGPVGRFEEADKHLRKSMGFNSILFMSMGAIIGSGWLLGSLDAASVAGPAAILSWVIGGVFIIFIALSYAELAGMLPRTGAIVRYPQLTHGAYTGWMVGWTYWLSAISVPAIEAEAVVTYVGGTYPGANLVTKSQGVTVLTGAGIGFAIGLMLFFFLLNFFGIRLLGEWNRWFTWWKFIIPIVTFCMLFLAFRGSNFTALPGGFFPEGAGNIFVAMSTGGVIFAFLGFRQALDYAGESKRPQRDVPLATISAVVIAVIMYALLQIGLVGALNWGSTGLHIGNWAGLTGSKWGATPLYSALQASGIGALLTFSTFLLVDAGLSPTGTGWIYLGTSARTNYGLGVNGYGPKGLQWHNKWGIPWISLIIALVIGCAFFVPAPSWYKLVGFITSTTVLTYIMGGLGVPVFRKYAGSLRRPFRLGWASLFAPLGFIAAAMLVFFSTFSTLASVYGAVFIGMPLFAWYFAIKKGWAKAVPATLLGVVFLGGWIYLNYMGGWVLRVKPPAKGAWGFGAYDIAMSAAVIFFCVGLWLISNGEGRKHVSHTAWFFFMLLAMFPVEYFTTDVGGPKHPPIPFGWGALVAVVIAIVAYYWGVASGFETEELAEIVRNEGAAAARAAAAPGAPVGGGAGQGGQSMPSTSTMSGIDPESRRPGPGS